MEILQKPDLLLIFTYAPAGLGHLRVTDALCDGLTQGVDWVLMGADDKRITYWHRLTTASPLFRGLMSWLQQQKHGYWFYDLYIWLLRVSTDQLYRQVERLILSQWQEKKTVVVVSTHFGLAHQIAKIKEQLEKNLEIRLILIVQVTDATSTEIWYVPEADVICVPSEKVKTELTSYAAKRGLRQTQMTVLPYPISLKLGRTLDAGAYELRLRQYSNESKVKINISVPISGAAIGLDYYDKLIRILGRSSTRYHFYVVTKDSEQTKEFIKKMQELEYVSVIKSDTDKKVVDSYEKLYEDKVIALEIVKPSEQAFKTLYSPNQRGGAILLLTEPIGKQEEDNLGFLQDHQLIPSPESQDQLWDKDCKACPEQAHRWRAIRLTNNVHQDVKLISWCLDTGIFKRMVGRENISHDRDLGSDGVLQFWQMAEQLVK